MKKTVIAVASLLLGATAYGQGGYASFSVGYGIGFPSEDLGIETVTNPSTLEVTEKNIYGTLGNGIGINLTPGYMLSEHFGAEIGLSYFMGSEVTTSSDELEGFYTDEFSGQTSQFRVNPSLVVRSGGDGISLYSKVGLLLPVTGTTVGRRERTGNGTALNPDISIETETIGALSLGYTGAIGVNWALSDKLSLFGEVSGAFLRIKSNETEITKFEQNGTNQLDNLSTGDKETVYVDELNGNTNQQGGANYDDTKPSEALAFKRNFNSTFINVGVTFKF